MLTLNKTLDILSALRLAQTMAKEHGTDADSKFIERTIKTVHLSMREGSLIDEPGDEYSEPDQTVGAMRHSYAGLL